MRKLLSIGIAVAVIAVIVSISTAQVTKGKTRLATTHQIMGGLMRPNCAALGKALKTAPADDKAWEALATNAALLNEVSYTLMADGRCPDGTWAKAATALRSGSAAVLAKIDAKDHAGAAAEFKTMTKACGVCHKAHKKKHSK